MTLKLNRIFLVALTLLTLSACDQKSGANKQNGVKDAIGARPYEKARDAAEDAGDAVKEVGRDIKDAVNGK